MVKIQPVRLMKRGHNFQIYYYNLKGERRRLSVGNDEQNAHRMVVKFNDWLLESKDPEREMELTQQAVQSFKITLRELFPKFMERHAKFRSLAMRQSYQYSFKNICRCPNLVNKEISSISKNLVLAYMHVRMEKDRVTAATVNREAAFLKCIFSRAFEWEIIKNDPLHGLKLFPESEKRDVYLTVDQAKQLIEKLPPSIADIVEFAIYTGFRKENILNLRIDSVRFDNQKGTAEAQLIIKGGRREVFPIGQEALKLLRNAVGNRKEGFVFINPKTGTRYNSIHKTFNRAVRELNLQVCDTKLRFHDLRHVFATWLHREGVSLDTLRFLMGHKNRSTTDRYTTIDRLLGGKVLSLMPQLRVHDKKSLDQTNIKADNNEFLTHIDTIQN